jgi:hypothetical protein
MPPEVRSGTWSTFFDSSAEKTVAALLGGENTHLSDAELDRLSVDSGEKGSSR